MTDDATPFATKLRGFGPVGVAAALIVTALGPIVEQFGAMAAVAWIQLSETPWSAVGFTRPKSWARTVMSGVAIGVALKLLLKVIVMPLLGAPPTNAAYQYLVGNTAALPIMMFDVIAGAGFGEELVFRGFLFERLHKLVGETRSATVAIVVATSLLFGSVHYPTQGLAGAEQAFTTGLTFGAIYARTRRLWVPMIAHAAFDIVAVVIIYGGFETRLAHLVLNR